jgi:hypothetical protein
MQRAGIRKESPRPLGPTRMLTPPLEVMRPASRPLRLFRVRRRGYTLVFYAMCLFAFMALAALVIDIGLVRLTQRQMQTAVDSSTVEGLRGDGEVDYETRRESARQFAVWHFDDDLDESTDDGAFDFGSGQFGAGPEVQFSGFAGVDPALSAGQTMSVNPESPVYKPVMMNGAASASGTFLVDMRRGTGSDSQADLYSVGTAVPFLFARGALVDRELIHQGVSVQVAGSATFQNVLSVGLADDAHGLRGLAPFALRFDTDTEDLDTQNPYIFQIDSQSRMPLAVGRALPESSGALTVGTTGYAPIYAQLPGASQLLVIGFVSATVEAGPTIVIDANQKAPMNASTILCYPREMNTTPDELSGAVALNRRAGNALSILQAART